MIERDSDLRFMLTGSSARKLKRGNANLLAGRAVTFHLHPLVSCELATTDLLRRLNVGSLPAVFDSPKPRSKLKRQAALRPGDYKGIRALSEEVTLKRRIVVSTESHARIDDEGIEIIPVCEFFKLLWSDRVINA